MSNPTYFRMDQGGQSISLTHPMPVQTVTAAGSAIPATSGEYTAVPESQTGAVLGATGATGDYLATLVIQPATTSPGNVLLIDGSTTVLTFPGGASSVSGLGPIVIPINAVSATGAWKVTTGANVSVLASGSFT